MHPSANPIYRYLYEMRQEATNYGQVNKSAERRINLLETTHGLEVNAKKASASCRELAKALKGIRKPSR